MASVSIGGVRPYRDIGHTPPTRKRMHSAKRRRRGGNMDTGVARDKRVESAANCPQDGLPNERSLWKALAINNVLSLIIHCAVIITLVLLIRAIDVLTGYGMGLEFYAVVIGAIAYVCLGNAFLIPVRRHFWASMIGSLLLVTIVASAYLHALNTNTFGSLDSVAIVEMLLVALFGALLPSFFLYVGLWLKVSSLQKSELE